MSQDYHLGGDDGGAGTWMPDIFEDLVVSFGIRSMIDIGCGSGANTKWFLDRGVSALGVEGLHEYIIKSRMPVGLVIEHDYTTGPLVLEQAFDLAWSSEFVEHVEEKFIPNFMSTFSKCRHACITHATPGQGGFHHVNEQLSEYWIKKFSENGFALDELKTNQYRATGPNTAYGRRTLTVFHNQNT